MNSVTFKFWITLEFSRRHGNLKPKRFDFLYRIQANLSGLSISLSMNEIIWSSGRNWH